MAEAERAWKPLQRQYRRDLATDRKAREREANRQRAQIRRAISLGQWPSRNLDLFVYDGLCELLNDLILSHYLTLAM